MKRPVYLIDLYRVSWTGRFARPGIGAILRLTDDTQVHLSKLEDETEWFIDFACRAEDILVNNGWGWRNTEYGEEREVNAIRQDVGERLDQTVAERDL